MNLRASLHAMLDLGCRGFADWVHSIEHLPDEVLGRRTISAEVRAVVRDPDRCSSSFTASRTAMLTAVTTHVRLPTDLYRAAGRGSWAPHEPVELYQGAPVTPQHDAGEEFGPFWSRKVGTPAEWAGRGELLGCWGGVFPSPGATRDLLGRAGIALRRCR